MNRNLILGGALTAVFVFAALVSFIWTPFDHTSMDIPNKLQGLGGAHFLGTDHFGRDILSMIMVGARTSIAVALVAVGIGMGLGIPLGLWAAARRGSLVDEVIMRGNDLVFAFPSLVIAILITAIFGASAINAIIAIGIFNIPVFARVARGGALSIATLDFVAAGRLAGLGNTMIAYRHLLPNIMSLLIVQGTIQMSLGILAEAGLSYIGLGTQPPETSLGLMLKDAQSVFLIHPWLTLLPGITIVLIVIALNIAGDGLRDAIDPRLRQGQDNVLA